MLDDNEEEDAVEEVLEFVYDTTEEDDTLEVTVFVDELDPEVTGIVEESVIDEDDV